VYHYEVTMWFLAGTTTKWRPCVLCFTHMNWYVVYYYVSGKLHRAHTAHCL